AMVQDGDRIRLDVPARRLDLLVDDAEFRRRRDAWRPSEPATRGWRRLYAESVLPASEGADLSFLVEPRRDVRGPRSDGLAGKALIDRLAEERPIPPQGHGAGTDGN